MAFTKPPATNPDGTAYHGNTPLENARREAFAQNVAAGENYAEAYRLVYTEAPKANVRITASKLAKIPNVKARIEWLKKAGNAQKQPKCKPVREKTTENPPEKTPEKVTRVNKSIGQISREEVINQLSVAIRHGSTSEITQATQALLKIMPELGAGADADKPDPLAVANYLAAWAGFPGHDLAKELGGLELLTRKWIHVLQIDVRELLAVVRKIARINTDSDATVKDSDSSQL